MGVIAGIKILVIEDTPEKASRVEALLSEKMDPLECEFHFAVNYLTAMRKLENSFYDLVILDLKLPAGGADPDVKTSELILRSIMSGDLATPTFVIGLTAHDELFDEAQQVYAENLLSLEIFRWDDDAWAEKICNKIRFLRNAKMAAENLSKNSYLTDVVLLTARYHSEFKPIFDYIPWSSEPIKLTNLGDDIECWQGNVALNEEENISVVIVCMMKMGLSLSATVTTQCCNIFRPRLVTMLGMCCGFNSLTSTRKSLLGDVVIVRETAGWQDGKYVDSNKNERDYRSRAQGLCASEDIDENIQTYLEKHEADIQKVMKPYLRRAAIKKVIANHSETFNPTPSIRCGAMVSGSTIIANEDVANDIIGRAPNALALDMEVLGVFTAVKRSFGKKPSVFAIKSVADFGYNKGDGELDDIQPIASVLSYITFIEVVKNLKIMQK